MQRNQTTAGKDLVYDWSREQAERDLLLISYELRNLFPDGCGGLGYGLLLAVGLGDNYNREFRFWDDSIYPGNALTARENREAVKWEAGMRSRLDKWLETLRNNTRLCKQADDFLALQASIKPDTAAQ